MKIHIQISINNSMLLRYSMQNYFTKFFGHLLEFDFICLIG
jgi:hypothetical protein